MNWVHNQGVSTKWPNVLKSYQNVFKSCPQRKDFCPFSKTAQKDAGNLVQQLSPQALKRRPNGNKLPNALHVIKLAVPRQICILIGLHKPHKVSQILHQEFIAILAVVAMI